MMTKKSVTKNSIFNIVYSFVNTVFPLIVSVYVARILLPTGVGKVSYAQNLASYFVGIAPLGLSAHGIREISKARDNPDKFRRTFSELFIINLISTTIAVSAYFFVILFFNISNIPLLLACGLQIVFNYINIDWFYQGQEEYGYIVRRNIIVKIAALFLIVLLVKNENDYIMYALITSIAVGGNNLFNIIHSRKLVRITIKGLSLQQHIKPLLILAASSFLSTIYSKIDITMLGAMASEESVAYYAYAQKIVQAAVTVCLSVSAALLPRLIYYYKDNIKKFELLLDKGFRILCFTIAPIVALVIVIGPYIVPIFFGQEFDPTTRSLLILVWLIPLQSFGNLICFQVVICAGYEGKRLPIFVLCSIVNIILNSILIPVYAEVGAAIASVVSEFLLDAILFLAIKKIVHIPINCRALLQAILSSAFSVGIVILFIQLLTKSAMNLLFCVIYCGLGMGLYLFFNYITSNSILLEYISRVKEKIKREVR